MANSDKNIVITPNIGSSTDDPKIVFSGANSTTGAQDVTLYVYPTDNGTLSIEGSAGQLLSVSNNLTGTLFSVNDVSGIPSITVEDNGTVSLAEFNGTVLIGGATDNGTSTVQISGTNSTSTSTGALRITGGIGATGDIHVGAVYSNGQLIQPGTGITANLAIAYSIAFGS